MAPKKRKKTRARRPAASRTHATPPLKVSRTPLRVDEPPRWPMLVWSLLVVVWVLGSLTALMGVMASVTVLLDDVTDQARRQGALPRRPARARGAAHRPGFVRHSVSGGRMRSSGHQDGSPP